LASADGALAAIAARPAAATSSGVPRTVTKGGS
jgi:hypothetical protein